MNGMDKGEAFSRGDISSTFVKGMAVLKAFDDTKPRLTLSEIAEITQLDRAAVRRLALTLVHLGYVGKSGRHFSLTPRILVLAGGFLRNNGFGTHIQPILNRFSERLGSAISLAMLDGSEAVYVAQSTLHNSAVSFGFTVGSRIPVLHTSIGRMLLAYGDPDKAGTLVREVPLTAYTNATVCDRNAIRGRIDEARTRGFVIVDGEFEAGVTGFSVPVGPIGQLKAVLGASEPYSVVADEDTRARFIDILQQCAVELDRSKILGAD